MGKRLCVLLMVMILFILSDGALANGKMDHMIKTLRSLGIDVSDAEAAQFENEVKEAYANRPNGLRAVDYYTYESLLSYLGMGDYNVENGRYEPATDDLYAFDSEAYDIVYAYEDLLLAVGRMGKGEIQVDDINVEWSPLLFQKGYGKMPVHYSLNGNEYTFRADFQTDWVDCGIIDDLNRKLQQLGIEKRLWNMYDGGQGLILFYNTEQWARDFEAETGCELEASTGATLGIGSLFDFLF